MAKKQSGPSTGLIITLVFFVLTTFIAGTVAYFGYSEIEDYKKKADEGEKKAAAALSQRDDMETKLLIDRIGIGFDSPDDRNNLTYLINSGSRGPAAMEELVLLNGKGGNLGFQWGRTADDKPEAAPAKSMLAISNELSTQAKASRDAETTAVDGRKKAEQLRDGALNDLKLAKDGFETKIKELEGDLDKVRKQQQADFNTYQADLKKRGDEIQDVFRKMQAMEDKLLKEIDFLTKKRDELNALVLKYQGQRDRGPDLAYLDQKKGTVDRRDGSFVYVDLGSAHYLRPQTTFSVLPSEGVWRNVEERQRQIKGQIEIIEILGPYSSRAKILDEVSPIRQPIAPKDQLFNLVWTPGTREHVAFAGIIDLNGDGLDDNLDFVRFIEKQGVIVDQWLDLRDRQIKRKGNGMSLQTKFLVMGPPVQMSEDDGLRKNDPRVAAKIEIQARMGEMQEEARKLGVQLIDYRKFLAMIGYKLPERPAPAEYGSSAYLKRGDGVDKPMDDGSPEPAPAPAPPKKKDEGR